jgi:hypothetical protein
MEEKWSGMNPINGLVHQKEKKEMRVKISLLNRQQVI